MSPCVNQFVDNHINKNAAKGKPPPTTQTSNIAGKKNGEANEYTYKGNEVSNKGIGHKKNGVNNINE